MRLAVLLLTANLILAGAWAFTTSGQVVTGLTPAGYMRRDTMSSGVADGAIGVPGMDQYSAAQVVLTSGGSLVTLSSDGTEDVAEANGVPGPVILSVRRDAPVTSSGTTGDYSTFNTNSRGGTWMTPLADPAGGALPMSYTSAGATEDEHVVCTAPCTIYSILITNTNAAVRYFRCNNDTQANTAPGSETLTTNGGGGTQVIEAAVPGLTTGAGFAIPLGAAGAYFSTAATCWMVTGAAITDVAEVAANEMKVFYTYRQ